MRGRVRGPHAKVAAAGRLGSPSQPTSQGRMEAVTSRDAEGGLSATGADGQVSIDRWEETVGEARPAGCSTVTPVCLASTAAATFVIHSQPRAVSLTFCLGGCASQVDYTYTVKLCTSYRFHVQ